MTEDVVFAEVPNSVEEVFENFKEGRHTGLPVVKKGTKKIVGIVTRSDFLRNPEEDQLAMVMTRDPVVVSEDDDIEKVSRLIIENNIRRVPVVDGEELIGIVSVADLVKIIAEDGINGNVEDYMEDECSISWVKTPAQVVAEVMRLSDTDAVIILDSQCNLAGVVSDTDLVKAFEFEDGLERSDMGAASDENDWTWDGVRDTMKLYYGVLKLRLPECSAEDIMTEDVVYDYVGTSVKSSAKKMARGEIEQIPVLDEDNRLFGILKDRDLVKTFI